MSIDFVWRPAFEVCETEQDVVGAEIAVANAGFVELCESLGRLSRDLSSNVRPELLGLVAEAKTA